MSDEDIILQQEDEITDLKDSLAALEARFDALTQEFKRVTNRLPNTKKPAIVAGGDTGIHANKPRGAFAKLGDRLRQEAGDLAHGRIVRS